MSQKNPSIPSIKTKPEKPNLDHTLNVAMQTLVTEIEGLSLLKESLNEHFFKACAILLNCQGRVVVTGMGKSGLIGRKIAATFASTGTPAFFMHPGEAGHGDLGMLITGDVLLAISNSGESDEIKTLLPVVKKRHIPLISMSKHARGTLPQAADVALTFGDIKEACPLGLAPTTSTTSTLVLGDMLAVALLDARKFTSEDFALSHPAGALGKKLLMRVSDVMHTGDALAMVSTEATLQDALFEMTSKRLGMTAIVEKSSDQTGQTKHLLKGIFTDGDLRRTLEKYHDEGLKTNICISHVMTKEPQAINQDMMASDALQLIRQQSINHLLVTDEHALIGIITLHDLVRLGLT